MKQKSIFSIFYMYCYFRSFEGKSLFLAYMYLFLISISKMATDKTTEQWLDCSPPTRAICAIGHGNFDLPALMTVSPCRDNSSNVAAILIWDCYQACDVLCPSSNMTVSELDQVREMSQFLFQKCCITDAPRRSVQLTALHFELGHQLRFLLDHRCRTVFVYDLNAGRLLYSAEEKHVYAVTMDNGLTAGYSRHVHFLAMRINDLVTFSTYKVGRKRLTLKSVVQLVAPRGHRVPRGNPFEHVSVLTFDDHIFVASNYLHCCVNQFQIHSNGAYAYLVRVIGTLDQPLYLGRLSNGHLAFNTLYHVYTVSV